MTRNIRGWILRRNYRRLHHATKTLQNATKSFLSARRERGGGGYRGRDRNRNRSGGDRRGGHRGGDGAMSEDEEEERESISGLATAMQAAARGRMVRSQVKRQRFAAGKVQRAWKVRSASQTTKQKATTQHDAAVRLQSRFKAVNARRHFIHMKKQLAACLIIERQLLAWRDNRRTGRSDSVGMRWEAPPP